jgi:putative redox protein
VANEVTLTWVQKKQFVGTDSSRHSIVISSQDEENGTGMKPAELLLLSLAACSAYDVVGILAKKKLNLTGLAVNVTGEQEPDPPWPYRRISMEFVVRGTGLTDKAVANAIHLSESKYCAVAATLRPAAEISTTYQIVEDA